MSACHPRRTCWRVVSGVADVHDHRAGTSACRALVPISAAAAAARRAEPFTCLWGAWLCLVAWAINVPWRLRGRHEASTTAKAAPLLGSSTGCREQKSGTGKADAQSPRLRTLLHALLSRCRSSSAAVSMRFQSASLIHPKRSSAGGPLSTLCGHPDFVVLLIQLSQYPEGCHASSCIQGSFGLARMSTRERRPSGAAWRWAPSSTM